MTWIKTKLGEGCDAGVLRVWMSEGPQDDRWVVHVSLRQGVIVGKFDWSERLATFVFRGNQDEARKYAVSNAHEWFAKNVDRLLGEAA
jgi:hypothetical protein